MRIAALERSRWLSYRGFSSLVWPIFVLLVLGLGFFIPNTHFELAPDDVSWLRGEAATVFDQYRVVPRLFFKVLNDQFGPSAPAALTMIFFFHFSNALLVAYLGWKVLNSPLAAWVAASVFLVNPLTLSSLTWISCFSYVLGTSMALVSIAAFWQAGTEDRTTVRFLWYGTALLFYCAGLLSSHTLFFLPALYPLLGWLQTNIALKRGIVLAGVAMIIALGVHFFIYNFKRYGIDTVSLLNYAFLSALASSIISYGLSLGLAYPLAFFVKPMGFLQICFDEPMRWILTSAFIAASVVFYRPSRTWRLHLVLALSFSSLITPYIIRLYLSPEQVGYHISYVLWGRVFYLPFVVVALVWGAITNELHRRSVWNTVLLTLSGVAGYGHALFVLYEKTDFMGLAVLSGIPKPNPPSWTPYTSSEPVWLAVVATGAIVAIGYRLAVER